MRFKDHLNEIKIVKLKWEDSIQNYKLDVNDNINHDMISKISARTKLLPKEFRDKVYKGLEYVVKKANDGKIITRLPIGLYFKKSDFTLSLIINPEDKYLRLNTVRDKNLNLAACLTELMKVKS